ncbi:unnamed protein product [Xylocopa violacea]|uniref:MADF domain-containing protein n=1 Tax=Xylocopa violacea TaxID=135666 RepID=A0ABP1NH85_XYLVO
MSDVENYVNLILTVKKYPTLYDFSCDDYYNNFERAKMWRVVAQEVNATPAECKEKWKNFLMSFNTYLGSQNSENSKMNDIADYLHFLLPYSKHRPDDGLNDDGTIAQETWNEDNTASDTSFSYDKLNKSEPNGDEDARNEEHEYSSSKVLRPANDRVSTHNSPNNCVLVNKRDPDELVNDSADLLFFKSLLPDVRQMSEHGKRNFKISVLRLIDKILTERELSMSVENDVSCSEVENQQKTNDED